MKCSSCIQNLVYLNQLEHKEDQCLILYQCSNCKTKYIEYKPRNGYTN